MTFRLTLLSVMAAATFASFQARAESIAVINYQKILHDSNAGKSVKEQLDAKQKTFQSEMSHKEEALNKEHDALAQQRAVLSPDAFEKKAKEFSVKANGAQKEVQTKRASLDNGVYTASTQIQKAVADIVSKLSKERGYTVVMPTSQLLYADPKLDITNDVLTQLNNTLPKVTVNFSAPSTPATKDEE